MIISAFSLSCSNKHRSVYEQKKKHDAKKNDDEKKNGKKKNWWTAFTLLLFLAFELRLDSVIFVNWVEEKKK